MEETSTLKLTKLDYRTLYPNNFEKQKVNLVCNVFNEKTVAALEQQNKSGTAYFVKQITRLWHILNIRSTSIGYRLNDVDRLPFTDVNDERFDFLQNMARIFKKMDNSLRGQRIRGLTGDTSNALHRTLLGFICLIKTLLKQGHSYVLPGKFSSDRTEGEFGVYRQSSGGNFLISAEQVINGLQLQRIKLFSQLDIHATNEIISNDCCNYELNDSEEDLNCLSKCFDEASDLSAIEKSTLYYICGYIAHFLSRNPKSVVQRFISKPLVKYMTTPATISRIYAA